MAKKLDNQLLDLSSEFISFQNRRFTAFVTESLKKMQSPIEKQLFVSLFAKSLEIPDVISFSAGFDELQFLSDPYSDSVGFHITVHSQVESGKYIVDFLLECNRADKTTEVVIECDGHDFHEKTKDQAAHDKKRDRFLIEQGHKVLHFTGSEIYNNSDKCANQAIMLLINEIRNG